MFQWFFHLKTATKLIIVFMILALIQAGIGAMSIYQLGKLNDGIDRMYSHNLKPIEEMAEARDLLQQLRLASRDLYLYDADAENILADVQEIMEQIEVQMDQYSQHQLSDQQKEHLSRFEMIWQSHKTSYDRALQLVSSGESAQYLTTLNGGLLNMQSGLIDALDQLMAADSETAEKARKDAQEVYSVTLMIAISVISFLFVISIVFGLWMARMISRPIGQVAHLVERVADGDLSQTANIGSKDEIGTLAQSVNKMVLNLRHTIQNILDAAKNLSASSEQVSASTEEVASASTNQANAAQTMSQLFQELSDAIHSVARNSEAAAKLSHQTMNIAQEGEQVVLSSIEGSRLVSEQMVRLEEDSRKIGDITEVINEIADQTNLLALNAAIEAARAGDQGRGFAVVADEVRKLAERSSKATTEIENIIRSMQEAASVSVKSVEEGAAITQKTGEAFEKIIQMIKETENKVTEIAGAGEQQSAQSSEVMAYIESVSAATEEAAASSEETASTALALRELSEELHASVATFKLNE
ncbi:methyl-accepting chemotaxis protein [Siminovitchia sediminis]|uniref:Methyl-accepting chemotaxis protein n=1 Tax=Siminovitchia sediminis TaxID=1274353 RepID=A0ABW4KEA2_9BACI